MALNKTTPRLKSEGMVTLFSAADGGINLSENARSIKDNESPDMLNFWLHGGQLRLRPGLNTFIEHGFGTIIKVFPDDGSRLLLRRVIKNGETIEERYGIYIVTQNAVLSYDGSNLEQVPDSMIYSDDWVKNYSSRSFDNCVIIPSGSESSNTISTDSETWTAKGEAVYIIGSGYFLAVSPNVISYEHPFGTPHLTAASVVSDINPYVPVLYDNCTPEGAGTKVGGRNILSKKRIQKFTTNSTSIVYRLCESGIDNDTLTAVYHAELGSVYTFNFPKDYGISFQNGIAASLDRAAGTIELTAPLADAKSLGLTNNFEVTYSKTYEKVPVKDCSIGTWYDGGAQSSAGSGRIFLSGDESAPNRIYFSSRNDPTYFAQDDYIDIGAAADPITAFGIQYDILAVFKKNSIYSLQYSDSESFPTFVTKIVNAGTGCDMPGTLRLLSNMLVWANSKSGVFSLLSTTVRDERAVRMLSQNVNARLLSVDQEVLKSAAAVCDETSYLLIAGDTAFIFNYDNLQFSGTKKPENAPWFIWTLPQKLNLVFRYGNNFAGTCERNGTIFIFDENAALDDGRFFDACWLSKSFDFKAPDRLKKLYNFSVSFGSETPCKLELVYRDSAGEVKHNIIADGGDFYKTLSVNPNAAWSYCSSFGIRRTEGDNAAFCIFDYTARAVCGARR